MLFRRERLSVDHRDERGHRLDVHRVADQRDGAPRAQRHDLHGIVHNAGQIGGLTPHDAHLIEHLPDRGGIVVRDIDDLDGLPDPIAQAFRAAQRAVQLQRHLANLLEQVHARRDDEAVARPIDGDRE